MLIDKINSLREELLDYMIENYVNTERLHEMTGISRPTLARFIKNIGDTRLATVSTISNFLKKEKEEK